MISLRTTLVLALVLTSAYGYATRPNMYKGYKVSELADKEGEHRVTLLFHLPGREALERNLLEISDPRSPSYKEYATKEELLVHTATADAVIDEWAAAGLAAGLSEVRVADTRDSMVLEGPVGAVEALAGVPFFRLEHGVRDVVLSRPVETAVWPGLSESARGALAYAVGVEDTELGTRDMRVLEVGTLVGGAAPITPAVIKKNYGVGNATGYGNNTQAVAEFQGQFYSPADLAQYLKMNSLPAQTVAKVVGNNDPNAPGVEASLDVQAIMGTGTGTPTWFVYSSDGATFAELIVNWVTALGAMDNPPLVNSISYGLGNTHTPDSLKQRIDAEFIKLGKRGVTIIFSSGDHGSSCTIDPLPTEDVQYPACSQFLLSVGATYLDSDSGKEIGATLSGGGFSKTEPMPTWQKDAVEAYLAAVPHKPPSFEWKSGMRAIPDISAYGENVQIVVGGAPQPVAGTSCSAPMSAAIFALVNGDLLKANKAPLGFVTPLVYQNGAAFNDVTSGRNSDGLCSGWEAIKGFDLVTGWGSPNYPKLRDAAFAADEAF